MKSKISNERFLLNAENRSFKEMFSEIAISLGKKPASIRATPALTETAWIFEAVKSILTGKESRITKETVRAGQRVTRYSNQKVTDTLNYSFIPLSDTVKYIAGLFLKDHS